MYRYRSSQRTKGRGYGTLRKCQRTYGR